MIIIGGVDYKATRKINQNIIRKQREDALNFKEKSSGEKLPIVRQSNIGPFQFLQKMMEIFR